MTSPPAGIDRQAILDPFAQKLLNLMPYKVRKAPVQGGPNAGKALDEHEFDAMLTLYYKKRGWDENGVPPVEIEERF